MEQIPWPIAAPSRVLPGNPAEAARFLAGKVSEVDLCCYFTDQCSSWGEAELPPDLAELPVTWHVHLPVDLPWQSGGAAAALAAARIWKKTLYLAPRFGVLHVPQGERATALLKDFFTVWKEQELSPTMLLLENVRHAPLLPQLDLAGREGVGICLDVAHAMSFNQTDSLDSPQLLSMVRLAHWSAPGDDDRHLPLDQWSPAQRAVAEKAARLLPPLPAHVLEVFDWQGFAHSWPQLHQLLQLAPAGA